MTDPETPAEPLIRAPNEQTAGAPARGSSRAFKVAGLTLLVCLLVAGQALTAYFVLSQRSDIQSLEKQNSNLKENLQRGRAAAGPMQVHVPMNALARLMDDSIDEEAVTENTGGTPDPRTATLCQLQAAGLKPVKLPDFRPTCDEQGFYRPQQCWFKFCWCVDPASGQQIPGSAQHGMANCGRVRGGMSRVMTLPDTVQLSDE